MMQQADQVTALDAALQVRAEKAWCDMSADIKYVLRKRLFEMNPFSAIKEIGRYYKGEAWSITPYPDQHTFGDLGLTGSKNIHDMLCKSDG